MILHYHNAKSKVKFIITRMRMWVHITVVNLRHIYCVPELYKYVMSTMVSLCSNLSCTDPLRFTVSWLSVTLSPRTEMMRRKYSCHIQNLRNYIRCTPQTVSVLAFCDYTQDPASQHMFQMFFDMLSLFILVWFRNKCIAELNIFFFDSFIFPGLIQEFCHIIIFLVEKVSWILGLRRAQLGTLGILGCQ